MNKTAPVMLLTAAAVLLAAQTAQANIGLPMIVLQMPFMIVLFLPVVLLEAVLLRHYLSITFKSAALASFKANAFSTFLGVPLAWFLHLLLGILVVQPLSSLDLDLEANRWIRCLGFLLSAAWLPPIEWLSAVVTLPAAGLAGLIPAYVMSVWVESLFITRYAVSIGRNPKRIMCRVNLFSYALLAGIWCIELWFSIQTKGASLAFLF